jgi:hypothetical protein
MACSCYWAPRSISFREFCVAAGVMVLLVPAPLVDVPADRLQALIGVDLLVVDAPKQCCRFCRKGKPCGSGCIL